MAGNRNAVRIAAIFDNIVLRPFYGVGRVLNECRKAHLGHFAIIGNNDKKTLRRIGARDPAIIVGTTFYPAAAIVKDQDRCCFGIAITPDVERLSMLAERDGLGNLRRTSTRPDAIKAVEQRWTRACVEERSDCSEHGESSKNPFHAVF